MNLPALHRASEQGHAHMVALLLKHGARVDMVDDNGDTALLCACRMSHLDVTRVLLAAGADTGLVNKQASAAHTSSSQNQPKPSQNHPDRASREPSPQHAHTHALVDRRPRLAPQGKNALDAALEAKVLLGRPEVRGNEHARKRFLPARHALSPIRSLSSCWDIGTAMTRRRRSATSRRRGPNLSGWHASKSARPPRPRPISPRLLRRASPPRSL